MTANDPTYKPSAHQSAGSDQSPNARSVNVARICPNCSVQLQNRHCKLECAVCGFFLSCSDFY